jgi:MarR family 2-MHQ and catechol resistance regulon transcriptional repressor
VKLEDHLVQSTFRDEGQKLHMHLLVIARQMDLMLRRILKPHGITPPQYNVLRILRGQKGTPIAVQSLAARMVDPSSNTSRIIDKLVDKGWADRQVCPEDRRRADVSITPAGADMLQGLDTPIQSMLTQSLQGVSDNTRLQMNAALAQVLNNTDDFLSNQN